MAIRFFKKSAALEDYDFDWSGWLVDNDFITTYEVTCDDGVTLGTSYHQSMSPVIKQFVSGGTHGNSYKVTCAILTDQGRSDIAEIIIVVRDLGVGGSPIPPEVEGDEMTVITEITTQVSFPQTGVGYRVEANSVVVMRTGQLITIMWSFVLDLSQAGIDHIEMLLPAGFQAKDNGYFAGGYSYSIPLAPLPAPPVQGAQRAAAAFIEPKTGDDRIAFYPADWTTFPQTNDYYFAGQMNYMSRS